MASGRLTKQNINNRGYNKYLKMDGEVTISINMEKYEADAAWDGIKGYVTNTMLTKGEVIANYSNLWLIERAFRMNKFDLPCARFRRLCHYCATNLNPKSAKMGTKMMCANNCDLHTSLIINYLELNNALSIHPR